MRKVHTTALVFFFSLLMKMRAFNAFVYGMLHYSGWLQGGMSIKGITPGLPDISRLPSYLFPEAKRSYIFKPPKFDRQPLLSPFFVLARLGPLCCA